MRIILLIMLSLSLCRAGYGADGTNPGDEITVVGKRIKQTPSSIDIIDLDDAGKPLESLSELLADRVGVQVKRYGGLGSYSTISVRGSNTNQVLVYLNGILLNDSIFGEVNLENYCLDSLERIEIYRGFVPVRFGQSGIGGAVNLVTKTATNHADTTAYFSGGSYGTYRMGLSRSQKFDSLSYFLTANRSASRGDFSFNDKNGTVVNPADDYRARRVNNRFESYASTGTVGYSLGTAEISLLNDFYYKRQGLPGVESNSTHYASLEILRNLSNVSCRLRQVSGLPLMLDLNAYYACQRISFDDSHQEIGLGGSLTSTGYDASAGGGITALIDASSINQLITVAVNPQYERYYNKKTGISALAVPTTERSPDQNRTRITVGIEDEISLFDKRWTITPQVRCDHSRDEFMASQLVDLNYYPVDKKTTITDWQIGTLLYLHRRVLYAKASGGTNHRLPSFSELFGDRGIVIGNSELRPEKSFSIDGGFGIAIDGLAGFLDRLLVEYAYFTTRTDDIIIFIMNSQHTMRAMNISRSVSRGHEVSASASFASCLDLRANYTYQEAIDQSDIPYYRGKQLPFRPLHEAAGSVRLYNRHAAAAYEASFTGSTFRDRTNSPAFYVKSRLMHNAMLQAFPLRGLTLSFEVKNIGNVMAQDIIGYPLPGRSYYGSCSYTF